VQSAEIKETWHSHRQTCTICGDRTARVCPVGFELHERNQEAEKPIISDDAKFIAGKIVKHLWIIFVLLPLVLSALFFLLQK
jgi:hypothetical protein